MSKGLVCIVMKAEVTSVMSSLPLAHLFVGHGYDIEYVGLFEGREVEYIRAQGFFARSFLCRPNGSGPGAGFDAASGRREMIRSMVALEEQALQECFLHYRPAPPVLVLFEILNTAWVASFVKLGVPLVAFSVTLAAPFNMSIPSVHSNLVLSRKPGIPDKLRLLANWTARYKGYFIRQLKFRLLLRMIFWNGRVPMVNYKKIFRDAGYAIQWGDYPGIGFRIKIPTLYLCPKEFDFPTGKQLANRIYAGTSVQFNRKERTFDWSRIDDQKKNIYCTMGSNTSFYDEKSRRHFYRCLVEAIGAEKKYNLILQIGNRADLMDTALYDNIYVYDWVPQLEVIRHIQLIICHGGLGTLREAIYHGVPSLVFPCGGDQPGNASRVVYHNLGIRFDFYTVTAADITAGIRKIEEDASIRNAVRTFQRSFKEHQELSPGIGFFESRMNRTYLSTTKS